MGSSRKYTYQLQTALQVTVFGTQKENKRMDNKTIHQIKFYQDGVKQEDGHAVRWQVGTYVPSIKATIDAIKHNTYHMKMFGEPCRTIICKQDGVSFDWKDYIGFSNGYGIEITYKTPTTDIDQRERELEQGGLYDED